MKNSKGFNLMSVIIIIFVTSIASAITAGVIVTNNYNLAYKGLSDDKELSEFLKTYSDIVNNYYEDIDKEKMIDSAIDGMLNYLGDNYTTYLNKDQRQELEEQLSGSYVGIGITYNGREIVEVAKNGPAETAGLKPGDKFVSINGTDVTEVPKAIKALIQDAKDEAITIVVERGEEKLTFDVKVGSVPTVAVSYKLLENKIGYLNMSIFSETLTNQVENALKDLEEQGMEKLIIDLRGNRGGYLDSAQNTASLFLEKGKLIYSLEDKNKKEDYFDETETSRKYPIVVLINGTSASSSEILASALKDSYGAVLVGETSYGKGKVQQTVKLDDGSMAKYTSAKWLRPNGDCVDGKGLIPDYEVVVNEEESTTDIDIQLNKAIEVIGAM